MHNPILSFIATYWQSFACSWVVVPQDLHSLGITGGSLTFGKYILKGCDPSTAATFIVIYGHFLCPFLLRKSSPHAVICKMGHAVLSYMARLFTPCARTHSWVRDITIWALSSQTPFRDRTLPNILGFTIGFFSTIPIIMVRVPANITGCIHTFFLEDLL